MYFGSMLTPPRGSEYQTDLWHTGTHSHWGGQCIWLHWDTACWNSRLCQSGTRPHWILKGTETHGNPEVTGRSSSRQLHCQELPLTQPTQAQQIYIHGIMKHTPCPARTGSLSTLKTEMAKSKRNEADGAQVVWTVCLPVKLRAH